jgi:peptide-methionine (S)-S-oxide reductase
MSVPDGPKDASFNVGTHPGGVGLHKGALTPAPGDRLAAFSAGCFWGSEDAFRHVPGVVATAVGFTGGTVPNPSYEQVCTHTTGHAETVLVEFDPKKVSYGHLLDWFWKIHDPTTVDRQGPDIGDNYRSAIWCYGDDELKEALASKRQTQRQFSSPIVTGVQKAAPFYLAEDYHQQYDQKTGRHSCPVDLPNGG